MSMNLKRRIAALEKSEANPNLPPSVRRWLGHSLTPAEEEEADRERAEAGALDLAAIARDDSYSVEMNQWLGAI